MISYETFRSMMDDFVKAEKSPGFKWRYEEFLKELALLVKDSDDFADAIKYMHRKKEYVDTIVRDWILQAMCRVLAN